MNEVLKNGTLSLRTAEKWLQQFRAGENDTLDRSAGGNLLTTNIDQIMK